MDTSYFKPWKGKRYSTTKVLILSESVYSWRDEGQNLKDPPPGHTTDNVLHFGIENFGKSRYYTSVGRALCESKEPTAADLKKAWDEYALTPFVQSSVGESWRSRPTKKQWQNAAACFPSLIEKLRPRKVIVTGKEMWNHYMPDCTVLRLCDELQAYKLSDGSLVWCLAVPHPSSRKLNEGFRWEKVGMAIRTFRSVEFPLRES